MANALLARSYSRKIRSLLVIELFLHPVSYVAICCEDFTVNTNVCPASAFDYAFSGQMSSPLSYTEEGPDHDQLKRSIDDKPSASGVKNDLVRRGKVIGGIGA